MYKLLLNPYFTILVGIPIAIVFGVIVNYMSDRLFRKNFSPRIWILYASAITVLVVILLWVSLRDDTVTADRPAPSVPGTAAGKNNINSSGDGNLILSLPENKGSQIINIYGTKDSPSAAPEQSIPPRREAPMETAAAQAAQTNAVQTPGPGTDSSSADAALKSKAVAEWSAGKFYAVNEKALCDGIVYICLIEHKSTIDSRPTQNSSRVKYWQRAE